MLFDKALRPTALPCLTLLTPVSLGALAFSSTTRIGDPPGHVGHAPARGGEAAHRAQATRLEGALLVATTTTGSTTKI